MLDTYANYCRFFIEDSEMIEEYRLEIERIGQTSIPVSKWWIDTIKYETHFGNLESSYAILERALKSVFKKRFKLVRRSTKSFCKKYKFYAKKLIKVENSKITVDFEEEEEKNEKEYEEWIINNEATPEMPKFSHKRI
uniref:Uncharacterized protein n=1 Tax=Panagrolaimus sp. ES5 TaxID=591445 RepID=A0AC34FJ61_9BILA